MSREVKIIISLVGRLTSVQDMINDEFTVQVCPLVVEARQSGRIQRSLKEKSISPECTAVINLDNNFLASLSLWLALYPCLARFSTRPSNRAHQARGTALVAKA